MKLLHFVVEENGKYMLQLIASNLYKSSQTASSKKLETTISISKSKTGAKKAKPNPYVLSTCQHHPTAVSTIEDLYLFGLLISIFLSISSHEIRKVHP